MTTEPTEATRICSSCEMPSSQKPYPPRPRQFPGVVEDVGSIEFLSDMSKNVDLDMIASTLSKGPFSDDDRPGNGNQHLDCCE